jgi:hypothetical protein
MAPLLALCLEDLDAEPEHRFLRCCALPDGVSGLALDHDGSVLWQNTRPGCDQESRDLEEGDCGKKQKLGEVVLRVRVPCGKV